jgi:hypothetical protein
MKNYHQKQNHRVLCTIIKIQFRDQMAPDQLRRNVPSFHLKCSYHRKVRIVRAKFLGMASSSQSEMSFAKPA